MELSQRAGRALRAATSAALTLLLGADVAPIAAAIRLTSPARRDNTMSIINTIKSIFSKAAATPAGTTTTAAVTTGVSTAVKAAAQAGNPIGAATLAAAKAAEQTGKSGAEKRADVIAAVVPVIATEAAKGGFTALEQDAETFASMVLEEVLAQLKTTPIVSLGLALLHVIGID